MIRAVLTLLLLAVASPAGAQITTSLRTLTDFGVFLNGQLSYIPRNTVITRPQTVRLVSASGTAFATIEPGPLSFSLTEGADMPRVHAAGTATRVVGPHDLIWILSRTGLATLAVDLFVFGGLTPPLGHASIQVDIDNNGSIEVDRSTLAGEVLQIPVALNGIRVVRARTSAWASNVTGTDRYLIRLELRLASGAVPATMTPYGASCGRASLTGIDAAVGNEHRLRFRAGDGTWSFPAVLLVFGNRRTVAPIGASGCLLYTDPVNFLVLPFTGGGVAEWSLVVPSPLRGTVQRIRAAFRSARCEGRDEV